MTVLARAESFTTTSELVVEECCNCHCLFAMPSDLQRRLRDNPGTSFYCPQGHSQHYTGPSEAQKLRKKLQRQEEIAAARLAALDQARADAEHERSRVNGYKGALAKTKKRAAKGVCPVAGCRRHFADVERHIASKHPDYAAGGNE